jgi:hypothetical protein
MGMARPPLLQAREQSSPRGRGGRTEVENAQSLETLREPPLQSCPPAALGQEEDAVLQLAENDGIDGQVSLIRPQPRDHGDSRGLLRRLAQDIGVDKEPHRVAPKVNLKADGRAGRWSFIKTPCRRNHDGLRP